MVSIVQVVATLVSEIVLCVKEVNQKTRAAAYGLLVELAHAMHESEPPPLPDLDEHMGSLDLGASHVEQQPHVNVILFNAFNAICSISLRILECTHKDQVFFFAYSLGYEAAADMQCCY